MNRESFLENIESINDKIDEAAIFFYQNFHQVAYEKVQQLLEDIILFISKIDPSNIKEILIFNDVLQQMMEALAERDGILVADILRYELKEKLIQFEQFF